ncbi:hypothetical protein RIF29_24107 [Crotalaria pallida]|uniref:WRKY domain-containing protein n=1 Tax=Crotalaria pallida TaxID=3830 RepID=A0AAN9EJ65_CROPI
MEGNIIKNEYISLMNELIQGKELAKQLCNHVVSSSPSSSLETNEFLIDKILSSYEKVLNMLNLVSNVEDTKTNSGNMMMDESPKSEVMDNNEFRHKDVSKKRKNIPRWTEQVNIFSRTGLEGSLDDGYSWRKYGQKDILGAKFPRGYYRCTYRNVQGCLATKHVQRSDEDPTIIEVTYRGRHTCTQAKHLKKASKVKIGLEENQLHNDPKNEPQQEKMVQFQPLEANTENLDTKEDIFSWFCFPSSSNNGSENEDNNNILSNTMMENHLMERFSDSFISQSTSESSLFCLPQCHLNNTGFGQHMQTLESDIIEIVCESNSVTNSPALDLDMLLEKGDFDTDFPFNFSEYFSS